MPNKSSSDSCTTAAKCASGKYKRVRYFSGMLLTEQDFQDEQDYLREKLKLHNRLHGAGVVWGLGLVSKCLKTGLPSPDDETFKIFVEAGFAIDCEGNEIIVCKDQIVPLDERILDLRRRGRITRDTTCDPPKESGPKLYIGVKYCECKSDPAAQYTSDCDDDGLHPQFSRVREGFTVQVYMQEELPGCQNTSRTSDDCTTPAKECPGLYPCCEDEHVIILGCVENYDAKSLRFEGDVINACYRPPYVHHNALKMSRRFAQWEELKSALLREVCQAERWIDFSGVIGLPEADAVTYLSGIGLGIGTSIPFSQVKDDLQRVTSAIPCAQEGTAVDVVVDPVQKCVLFAMAS